MESKQCKVCSKEFFRKYKYSKKQWEGCLYCSYSCSNKDRPINEKHMQMLIEMHRGVPLSEEHRYKISKANKGKKKPNFTKEHLLNMSLAQKGKYLEDKSPSWKGDEVGYGGVHKWITKKLGQPNKCDKCRTMESYRFEWANISGEYRRDLKDWIRLCVKCHRKMDDNVNKMWVTRHSKP